MGVRRWNRLIDRSMRITHHVGDVGVDDEDAEDAEGLVLSDGARPLAQEHHDGLEVLHAAHEPRPVTYICLLRLHAASTS